MAHRKLRPGCMYSVEPMTLLDVPEVSRIERKCFTNPWPPSAYRRELRLPEQNYYIVMRHYDDPPADERETGQNGKPENGIKLLSRRGLLSFGRRDEADGKIVGFAGMWNMYDEAHVTTIGVDPDYRGQGLGELLFVSLIDEAMRRGAGWLTLEVRVSNEPAQSLYRKYEFTVQGTRKRYYSDNNEDAYIMWSPSLNDPDYVARVMRLRAIVARRFGLPHPPPGVTLPSPNEDVEGQPSAETSRSKRGAD